MKRHSIDEENTLVMGNAGARIRTSQRDLMFDDLLPGELRRMSAAHWTPFDVVLRVVSLLNPAPNDRVLDLGSGVGKVCSIGALASPARWSGIEQHEPLVGTANLVARRLGVAERTRFFHGDAFDVDWRNFEALYIYNPFEVPLFCEPPSAFDHALQITRVQQRLCQLDAGTRVVTLHGFGGVMPRTFELLYQEHLHSVGLDLVLWKQRPWRPPP